jgi:hypothetical protein
MAFLLMLLTLFLQYFKYVSPLYQCHVLFTNFQEIMIISVTAFAAPINAIVVIYCYVMYYIKDMTKNHQ